MNTRSTLLPISYIKVANHINPNIYYMKTLALGFILLAISSISTYGQGINQTVKGRVVDSETQQPIAGANISVQGTQLGVSSGSDGFFKIVGVPVGRYDINISFIGYEASTIPNITVTSAKEVVLSVAMKQSFQQMEQVVVRANGRKDRTVNTMANISARTFSVEETRRYAGGLDDPARMASAFAGVTVGNIQDNAISIRGNTPKSVLWRVEGVEIPNPNHFAGGNVAGGGFVSLFSSQMLSNSDFFTGAFPAEYANAMAGVFDIKLRTGNSEKYENTVQVGVMGIDLASEGPLSKGKGSSYLFNYRYSTAGLLSKLKIIPTDQVPVYQDLSFKVNIPTKTYGTFSIWGIGGVDHLSEPVDDDSTKWETSWDRLKFSWDIYTGAAGLSHKITLGKTYISTTVALSGTSNELIQDRYDDYMQMRPNAAIKSKTGTFTASTTINSKISQRHTLRAGLTLKQLFYNLDISNTIHEDPTSYQNMILQDGASQAYECFWQSKYQLSNVLNLQVGVNTMLLALNNSYSVDPRISLKYQLAENHSLTLGMGKHSQIEELRFYFIRKQVNGENQFPNKNLKLAQAHHIILGYDWNISKDLRLKLETYYQQLYRVPGIADSSYSLINFSQDWAFYEKLVNNTKGRNFGVDVTFERFLSKGYYYLATASIFSSKYKAGDNTWHNTRFNKGYSVNLLAGKEVSLSKNRTLGANARVNFLGGERKSPILEAESIKNKRAILDESKAFSEQYPSTYYLDVTLTYRTNHKKYTGTWALQVKNILGSPIYSGPAYNFKTKQVEEQKVTLVLPVISYRIDF